LPLDLVVGRDVFVGAEMPPTDDTPTVISKVALAPLRPEEALAAVLRGRVLAHFELLEPIGVGGMAAVVRAQDKQLDRCVALKILPPELAKDPEAVRRFHQEARAAAKLDHENIARVFYCGEDQGLHFIAFEYVEGENLRTLLDRRGLIPVPEALGYMLQIATGLAHAASRGVVHRDIKPSNMIISPNGRAKLVDMGLARSLERQADGGLTQSGVTLGTFDYISPEQALEPRDADVRSDIYSLGCTFYHMLTGQPPVPDGTAAKKLHHHQHIEPLDPRQLNPDIPDDVAGLLARMMAKDPAKRYQRPEELVQHLFVLAQKLGAVSEVPEGVLFLDAPLPGPPRTRPLLLAGVAVLGLVTVIAFIGPSATLPFDKPVSTTSTPAEVPKDLAGSPQTEEAEVPTTVKAQDTPEQTAPRPQVARSPEDLATLLREQSSGTIYLSNEVNWVLQQPLVFEGTKLTLAAENPQAARLPTLHLDYHPDKPPELTALQVRKGVLVCKGIRWVLDAAQSPETSMTAIEQQGGELTLQNCQFEQQRVNSGDKVRLSAVRIRSSPNDAEMPSLTLEQSTFLGGKQALAIVGPAHVIVRQCLFGPFSATVFGLQGDGRAMDDRDCVLSLAKCSALLAGRSLFQVGNEAKVQLVVKDCFVGRPDGQSDKAALVEQSDDQNSVWNYQGSGNRYYNLGAFWLRGNDTVAAAHLPEFVDVNRQEGLAQDNQSRELTDNPWVEGDPLKTWMSTDSQRAFLLKTDKEELRQVGSRGHQVGAELSIRGSLYEQPLPLLARSNEAVHPQDKVVDPTLVGTRENTYKTLLQALLDARPGDTVLIKYNGELKVDPVSLDKPGTDVTIKPFPDTHPILTVATTTEPDAALFKLHDGQLHLEHLEFRLAPDKPEYRAQSVVLVLGDGQCSFKGCVATLEDSLVPLALVTVADPSAVMKMAPQNAQQDPRIVVDNCFVRGTGRLVAVRACRSFQLAVQESLVALAGSLLSIDGNPREQTPRPLVEVSLTHVTTYLNDHLILLHALRDKRKGLGQIVVKAGDCLFTAALGKSLVHLDGVDTDDQMRNFVSWGPESRHNSYCNFLRYLDQESAPGGPMAPPAYGKDQWKMFINEDTPEESHFEERVRFQRPPERTTPMSQVDADNFRTKPQSELQGYGVNVELLPRPGEDNNR
jgi:serine/threonine protein kinase